VSIRHSIRLGVGILALLAFAVGQAAAGEKKEALKVGDKAPVFESTDDQGKPWKSSDHVGKKVMVIYFYPADLTGGCTAQACGFRDDSKTLTDKGVKVVGISGDSAKNHQLFMKVHELNFTLLADEDGSVAKKFGVPVNKGGTFNFKDKDGNVTQLTRGVTIARWTFVIDRDGNIAAAYAVPNAGKDSKKVLETVEKLEKK
jgi:peroxiredoxin Q/BCP